MHEECTNQFPEAPNLADAGPVVSAGAGTRVLGIRPLLSADGIKLFSFIAGEILAADANEAMQMKNSIAKNASVDRFVEEEEENIVVLFLLVVCIK